jgi:hypothetical protein
VNLKLHPQHGVNPTVEKCFFCNKDKGVALLGAAYKGEAPRSMVINHEPCDECKGYMEQGVILISCREPKTKDDQVNPYRTGGWAVVRDALIKRAINDPKVRDDILRKRFAFIPNDAWSKLGLPMDGVVS